MCLELESNLETGLLSLEREEEISTDFLTLLLKEHLSMKTLQSIGPKQPRNG